MVKKVLKSADKFSETVGPLSATPSTPTLRAKGPLIREARFSSEAFSALQNCHFSGVAWEKRMLQRVEHWGSLISVPLTLGV